MRYVRWKKKREPIAKRHTELPALGEALGDGVVRSGKDVPGEETAKTKVEKVEVCLVSGSVQQEGRCAQEQKGK